MSNEKNLYQRIMAVSGQAIGKDTFVKINSNGAGYKALSHDKVMSVMNPLLNSNGLVFIASEEDSTTEVIHHKDSYGKDKTTYFVNMKVKGEIINADKPDERHIVYFRGHGQDSGDKAPGKAASYGAKMCVLKAFNLVTGENDESRDLDLETQKTTPQPSGTNEWNATDGQKKKLTAMLYRIRTLENTKPSQQDWENRDKVCSGSHALFNATIEKLQREINELEKKFNVNE